MPNLKATINDVTIDKHINGRKTHRFSVPFKITLQEARQLQLEASYHPNGYGFYGFLITHKGTTWYCSDSCD